MLLSEFKWYLKLCAIEWNLKKKSARSDYIHSQGRPEISQDMAKNTTAIFNDRKINI